LLDLLPLHTLSERSLVALVHKLVEQMHGKIEVESAYNRTTFTVQLPSMLGLDLLALQ
jgi:nitrogen-specific signal transduction histidine kinase